MSLVNETVEDTLSAAGKPMPDAAMASTETIGIVRIGPEPLLSTWFGLYHKRPMGAIPSGTPSGGERRGELAVALEVVTAGFGLLGVGEIELAAGFEFDFGG